jgi:hypothetical protein
MFNRRNVGRKERWARLLIGALLVACSLGQIGFTPLGIALALAGVMMALTGLVGFCPAYAMAGRPPIERLR